MSETIIAQATPHGSSAIAVIRVSGPLSRTIAREACKIDSPTPRQAKLANYHNHLNDCIDQVIITYFDQGRSYTGSDTLEICPHGNPLIVELILKDLIDRGCRIAQAGEFTKNAFIAGKIDLTQAEAVAKIINANSEAEIKIANNNLKGKLSKILLKHQKDMIDLKAKIEAYLDFPEDDIPQQEKKVLRTKIEDVHNGIVKLIQSAKETHAFKGRIRILLLGPPNAGKSTIFNELIGSDRALVSDIQGTTRDYINEDLFLDDFKIELIDAAGIHSGKGNLEKAGISKTLGLMKEVNLILCVLDSSLPYPNDFFSLVDFENISVLLIENKSDLDHVLEIKEDAYDHRITISATNQSDIEKLKHKILELIKTNIDYDPVNSLAVESRHKKHLSEIDKSLMETARILEAGVDFELMAYELDTGLHSIGEIIGRKDNEDMLDSLFNQFCIGK